MATTTTTMTTKLQGAGAIHARSNTTVGVGGTRRTAQKNFDGSRRCSSPHKQQHRHAQRSFNSVRQRCRGRGTSSATTTAALPPDAAAIAEVANLFDNPLEKLLGGGGNDGDLPGWFPFASFVAYLWISNEAGQSKRGACSSLINAPVPCHTRHRSFVA